MHEKNAADKRDRDGDQRDQHGAQRAEEKINYDRHDDQGLRQGLQNFIDRGVDIFGSVISDFPGETGGEVLLNELHFAADALDHVERIGVRQHPDPHEDGPFAREPHLGVIILRAEFNVGDIAKPEELVPGLANDQVAEFLDGAKIGVGAQVDLHQRAFGVANR